MPEVRLALVGAGVIGRRHIEAIGRHDGARLAAIADPGPDSAGLARELKVPHFTDYREMLDTVRPDGVIVATPTEIHLEPALAVLAAGVHVLIEKPVTATVAEAEELIAHLQSSRGRVLVGHQRRYYDTVQQARAFVQGGKLGRLVAVTGQWTTRKPDDYYKPAWRKRRAAGPVLTNLIHEIDTLRVICGEISAVGGQTSNHVQGFAKEDVAAITLRFESGALGTFILSDQAFSPWGWEQATGENRAIAKSGQNAVRFIGTGGSLEFPNLVLWTPDGERCDWGTPLKAGAVQSQTGDPYMAQIAHFCAVVSGEAEPLVTVADAARSLAATVAVFEASQSGRTVSLLDSGKPVPPGTSS